MKSLDPWAFSLGGTALIEASAGTGKTHTLTTLYLRLLVERDLLPSQILVVTYTKAATAELRERLRDRIREAIRLAEPEDAPRSVSPAGTPHAEGRTIDPELQRFARAARARADREGRIDALRCALREFDEAAIFTIHGFCARALQEHAFESGLSFDTELVEHSAPLERTLARDLWQRLVHDEPPVFVEWLLEGSGRRWRFDPDALWIDLVRPLGADEEMPILPDPGAAGEAPELAGVLDSLDGAWRAWAGAWRHDREERVEWLLESGHLHKGWYPRGKVESEWIPALDAWAARWLGAESGGPAPATPALPSWWKWLVPEGVEKGTTKGNPVRQDGFFEACARVQEATRVLEEAFAARALALRRRLVDEIREAARRRRQERHVLFFDDLLSELRRAVRGPEGERLVALLRQRHPYALIDEFQDTDPVQYEIFQTVWHRSASEAREASGGLLLIGDPKQAVYSFRGADVFTYLHARADAGNAVASLAVNHRSDPGLVQAVNTLFDRPARPFGLEEITFQPVSPSPDARPRLEAPGRSAAGLRVVRAEHALLAEAATNPDGAVLPLQTARAEVWPAFARDVVELLDSGARIDGRPVVPSDIAVLCRKKRDLQRARDALEAMGVPCVDRGDQDVFETREAEELVRVLHAMLRPADPARLRAALATAAHDRGVTALATLDDETPELSELVDRYAEYGRIWAESGFACALETWRREEDVTPRLLAFQDGERRLANWLHLIELVQGVALERALSRVSLLAWLERAIADEDVRREAGSDASLLRLERDDEAVSLVTLHRSKGLQYEIVYLPCLWENDASRLPSAAGLEDGRGQIPPIRFHDGTTERRSLDLGGADHAAHAERAEEEDHSERLRLLYVGLTRARRQCVVFWAAAGPGFAGSPLAWLLYGSTETERPPVDRKTATREIAAWKDQDWLTAFQAAADAAGPGAISIEALERRERARWQAPRPGDRTLRFEPIRNPPPAVQATTSFSALIRGASRSEESGPSELGRDLDADVERPLVGESDTESDLAGDMDRFPRGAAAGSLLHDVLEKADLTAPNEESIGDLAVRLLERNGLDPELRESVLHVVRSVARTPLEPRPAVARLGDLEPGHLRSELEFTLAAPGGDVRGFGPGALAKTLDRAPDGTPLKRYAARAGRLAWSELHGYLRGFVDAVFHDGQRYFIVDYKSNHLGPLRSDYRPDRLLTPMIEHDYVLQYLIYSIALDRHLAHALEGYDYERHFGGVYYLFLRGLAEQHEPGCGIFYDRPDRATLRGVSALLGGAAEKRS